MFKEHFQNRIVAYLFICTIFIMGIFFGSLATNNMAMEQKQALNNYLINFFQTTTSNDSLPKNMLARQSIMDNVVKTVGVMWLLGLSILGAPLILVVIFIRGFVVGFTIGFLLQEMFWRGLILTVASVLPHNLIILPAILVAGAAAISFSWTTVRVLMGKKNVNIYHQLLMTTSTISFAVVLLVGGAFVEAFITPVLIDFVNNYLI